MSITRLYYALFPNCDTGEQRPCKRIDPIAFNLGQREAVLSEIREFSLEFYSPDRRESRFG